MLTSADRAHDAPKSWLAATVYDGISLTATFEFDGTSYASMNDTVPFLTEMLIKRIHTQGPPERYAQLNSANGAPPTRETQCN